MLPDRVSNPGPLTYESGALPIALRGPTQIKEGSKVINCDWVNHQTCRLSYYIYIKSNTVLTYDNFSDLTKKKSDLLTTFFNLYTKSP